MKHKSLILFFPLILSVFELASCAEPSIQNNEVKNAPTSVTEPNGEKTTIRILHQEDYMDESLIDNFMELYPEVNVVFDTTETNETLYNELQTGKSQYDLVTCSEYMIQRLASERLVQKIALPDDSAYKTNVSHFLTNPEKNGAIDTINVIDYKTNENLGVLSEYTAGYMWGTLGTVVNPYYKTFKERNMDKDQIVEDLRSIDGWSKFWDPQYKGAQSIKDSMRDSYALGIFEVFKDEFLDPSLSYEVKNKQYFNNHEKETITAVKDALIDLKSNIFGFEVDSGKNDIVTGKIGMNLAWSGDACFSIMKGEFYPGDDESYEDEKPEDKKTKLYYNIPKSGSNIWFDGFAMPSTTKPGSKEYEYTLKFIDYLSSPEQVVANMSYTGYTSFMSGNGTENNPIRDYVLDSYNCPDDEDTVDYDISYFFNGCSSEDMTLKVNLDSYEGRMLVAQYPEEHDIDHLYVMEDYGKDNSKIVQMWEDVKVNPLPTWIVVTLLAFVILTLGYFGSYKIVKAYKVKKRKSLRNSNN